MVSVTTRFLDKTMNTDLLESFFGNNELSEMERQLKSITWQIMKQRRRLTLTGNDDFKKPFKTICI